MTAYLLLAAYLDRLAGERQFAAVRLQAQARALRNLDARSRQ